MKDLKILVKDVERDLLLGLVLSLKHKRLTLQEAGKYSQEFLSNFPYGSYDTLFETLQRLSNESREARKVYVKYAPEYFEEERLVKLINLRKEYLYG